MTPSIGEHLLQGEIILHCHGQIYHEQDMFLALLLLYHRYTTNDKFVLPHNNDHNPYRQELFLSFSLSVVHNKHTIVTYKRTIQLAISAK